MFPTFTAITKTWSLDEVVERLKQRPEIAGILLIGSSQLGSFNRYSDLDLLLVLAEMPAVPLHVLLTHVEGRLADVIFTDMPEINQLLTSSEAIPPNSHQGKLLYWLQIGQLLHDASGKLAIAQKMLGMAEWLGNAGNEAELYTRWLNTNYNIEQNRRILTAPDFVYQLDLDLHFLACQLLLWSDYFLVRHLARRGSKAEICYLQTHDPAFLEQFQQLLAETDRGRKQALYEALAGQVFEPLGGLWPPGTEGLALGETVCWSSALVQAGLDFWHGLLADADGT